MHELATLFSMGPASRRGANHQQAAATQKKTKKERIYLVAPQRQLMFNIMHRGHFRGRSDPALLVSHIASKFYLNPWKEHFHHQLPVDLAKRFHAFQISLEFAMGGGMPSDLTALFAQSFWSLFKASVDDDTIQACMPSLSLPSHTTGTDPSIGDESRPSSTRDKLESA